MNYSLTHTSPQSIIGLGYLVPFCGDSGEVFFCPTAPPSWKLGTDGSPWPISINEITRSTDSVRPERDFEEPNPFVRMTDYADKCIMAERCVIKYAYSISTSNIHYATGTNALYGDGHVSWINSNYYKSEMIPLADFGDSYNDFMQAVFEKFDEH